MFLLLLIPKSGDGNRRPFIISAESNDIPVQPASIGRNKKRQAVQFSSREGGPINQPVNQSIHQTINRLINRLNSLKTNQVIFIGQCSEWSTSGQFQKKRCLFVNAKLLSLRRRTRPEQCFMFSLVLYNQTSLKSKLIERTSASEFIHDRKKVSGNVVKIPRNTRQALFFPSTKLDSYIESYHLILPILNSQGPSSETINLIDTDNLSMSKGQKT